MDDSKFIEGLTYDDVLLVPQHSYIDHRSDVDTTTRLSRNIELKIPLVSANMDTVTEYKMAIAMAEEGGFGIIHRFMTIEDQVEQVRRVKRDIGYAIDDILTIDPEASLKEVHDRRDKTGTNGFIVIDEKKKCVGILSKRDYLFEANLSTKVADMMTPLSKLITLNEEATVDEAIKQFRKKKIEKIPVLDKKGRPVRLITVKSVIKYEQMPNATKDGQGRYRVGAAVGVVGDFIERAEALYKAGVDALVVDVAHGHNDVALRAVKSLRKKFKDVDIVGGNVATGEGAKDLIESGVDAVKVGVGPGGLCTTRMVAGVGYPQLTAVMNAAAEGSKKGIPVIADGGTNYIGDICKALAAGASCSMLAGWFAGTDESPGGIIVKNGTKFKVHRGSASFTATADRKLKLDNMAENKLNTIVAEGVESLIPYKGSVKDIIYQLVGGLRSGMSYCNAKTIPELQKNAKFVKITDAGFRESKAHNVAQI